MRFILTENSWVLDALTPGEWHLVSLLPPTASGEAFSESARKRLFPPPFAPDEPADEDTLSQIEDWEEYVQPELEILFERDWRVVGDDLKGAESFSPDEILEPDQLGSLGDISELRRVTVPHENTESWYSALNQARLLMNAEHQLTDSDGETPWSDSQESEDGQRMLLLSQYELYSIVQSILVENVMNP